MSWWYILYSIENYLPALFYKCISCVALCRVYYLLPMSSPQNSFWLLISSSLLASYFFTVTHIFKFGFHTLEPWKSSTSFTKVSKDMIKIWKILKDYTAFFLSSFLRVFSISNSMIQMNLINHGLLVIAIQNGSMKFAVFHLFGPSEHTKLPSSWKWSHDWCLESQLLNRNFIHCTAFVIQNCLQRFFENKTSTDSLVVYSLMFR